MRQLKLSIGNPVRCRIREVVKETLVHAADRIQVTALLHKVQQGVPCRTDAWVARELGFDRVAWGSGGHNRRTCRCGCRLRRWRSYAMLWLQVDSARMRRRLERRCHIIQDAWLDRRRIKVHLGMCLCALRGCRREPSQLVRTRLTHRRVVAVGHRRI